MTDAMLGAAIGLAVLAFIALFCMFKVGTDCNGDCHQGRDCDCKGEKK